MLFTTVVSLFVAAANFAVVKALDPDSIPLSDRLFWCSSQEEQCPLLCLQYPGNDMATVSNTCDAETLQYSCVCNVNGLSPNATEYSLTLPYFICTETNNQCVKACGNHNNECANHCRTDHPCGAQSPPKPNKTATATPSSSKTGSPGSKNTGGATFGGQDTTKEKDKDGSGVANAASLAALIGAAALSFAML